MKTFFLSLCFLPFTCFTSLQAAAPVVSNVSAGQQAGTKMVDIYYDLSASTSSVAISAQVSADGGLTYIIPAVTFSGSIGAGVTPGAGKHIVWNAGADWNGQWAATCRVRVTASDTVIPTAPAGMAYIPAGPFQMGDSFSESADALPLHSVQVSAFFMDANLVSGALWQAVQSWGSSHGYSVGSGSWAGNSHPVQTVSWYECVKWCNARSEMQGLTPVYYTDVAQTIVYRGATNTDIASTMVKWSANGYRLPTEAEWEKAARGGLLGQRYPWGNTIANNQANYSASGDPFESGSPATTPCGYYNGGQTPAGVNMANGYGLYDMAGNVWEWCWDWYGSGYYADPTANSDPRGPASGGSYRVLRGGAWNYAAADLRCARRYYYYTPANSNYVIGFRCSRGL